ncbi:hypothetical protein DYD21_01060 [Rhodohalobacter sp. SW132]|uniref:hypothetical protein n=1 Tax=Rhodohalobacter sp. SW132 TaxID=2293433 RepID=UPI000E22477B|nr:hypothetical protein [Rhodohalobacter sp. SW132]REL38569.1 hypothetical protein DYD21_01060 [Rhodohalobacter sp. SW132]
MNIALIFIFSALFIEPPIHYVIDNDVELVEVGDIPIKNERIQISTTQWILPFGGNFLFVQSNPVGVSAMDVETGDVAELGSVGQGPFEWRTPRYAQVIEDELLIWDDGNLKIIGFDETFQPSRELTGIRHGVRAIQFTSNGLAGVLHDVPMSGEYVKIYRFSEDNQPNLKESFGEISEEGRKLIMILQSGGILWNGDDLLWSDPAVPELNIFNTNENKHTKIAVPDNDFAVEPWGNRRENRRNVEEFIFSNSRIVSLQKLDEFILVEIENFSDDESSIRYHLFDFDYNYIGNVNAGEGGFANYIRGVDDGNRLLYWGEDYTETGELNSIKAREVVVR